MHYKTIILLALLLLFLPTIAYVLYHSLTRTTTHNPTAINSTLPVETINTITLGKDTGTEYQNIPAVVAELRKGILDASSTDTRSQKLFKKTIYHQIVLSPENHIGDDEVINEFNDMYLDYSLIDETQKAENRNLLRLKAYALYVLYESYINHSPELFLQTKWAQNAEYLTFSSRYSNQDLDTLLYFDNLMRPVLLFGDILTYGQKIHNLSVILNNYNTQLSSADKAYLVDQLRSLLDTYHSAHSTVFSTFNTDTIVFPMFYEARGLSVLSRYKQVDDTVIKQKFSELFSKINNTALSKDDRVYQIQFRADMEYATYLFLHHNLQLTNDTSLLLKDMEGFPAKYKDNQAMLDFVKRVIGTIRPTSTLYKIASQDKTFKTFLALNM